MRIAWLGEVAENGGVGGIGTLLLDGILNQGIQVDYYCTFQEPPASLRSHDNLKVIYLPSGWEWNRWYNRNPFIAFLSGTIARTRTYAQLCDRVIENYANQPYDCIFQLSQTELFKLGRNLHRLPPIIVYPCVHAAGELRWHRIESAYALQSEKFWMHYITRLILTYRSWLQKRELRKPTLILGMSQRFNQLLSQDYDVDPQRQGVLYHPIRQQDEAAAQTADAKAQDRSVIRLLFVARISVRKGLQYITELSHRLDDLAGQVQIEVVGDRTQWSDYRAHLKDLNPNTARYLGGKNNRDVMALYDDADILLLPSLYEPGGIVVGEALSHGLCVVTSDAVGSAEVLDSDCHREFPAGNMDRFEQQVRQLITDLKTRRQELRETARNQCQHYFTPPKIASDLVAVLERVTKSKAIKPENEQTRTTVESPANREEQDAPASVL